ncbi:carbohydrate ABC transporter permease [Schaalia hyovaginalis]|uniref:carbohydrate ABC transporter permease n=1 Tax=Schaalia hyovaginalis TaxID=29316 RepID=UPI0026EB6BFE|nr:sugar ABC transporter permease [Schaalia hyovaginalis]MCI6411681.1 sugar ABC transporter permease [Schaalia hyovaginalis]
MVRPTVRGTLVGGAKAADRGPGARVRKPHLHYYLIPAALYLAALSLFPLIQLFRLALSDVTPANLYGDWNFVGLSNFIQGFTAGELGSSLIRTLVFVGFVTLLGMVGGVAAATTLRDSGRWSSWLMALMVFVWALPPVINGSVWKFLLAQDGLANLVIRTFGSSGFPFLYSETFALASIAFVNAWALIPFNALVFRASILGIDSEVFEAAQIDGARPSQELRYILLPLMKPTALVLLVLTIVNAFRSFDFIYVMTRGGPGASTQTLPYLSFQQAFVSYDFSGGAATSVLALLLVLILAAVYSKAVLKEEE